MKLRNIFIISVLSFGLWSCHSHKHDDNHSHETEEHNHDDDHYHAHGGESSGSESKNNVSSNIDEIVFTQAQAEASGLKTQKIEPADFFAIIKTCGQVLPAQGDEITVSATNNGVVTFERNSLVQGAKVNKGEVLLFLSSQNVENGNPVQKARIAYGIAQSDYERAKKLYEADLMTQRDFNEIRLVYEQARIEYQSFTTQSHDHEGVDIMTPIAGFVKSIYVKEGDFAVIGQPLFTITQNKKLNLRADVSERYYHQLKMIQSANFQTAYSESLYKLNEMNGKFISFGRSTTDDELYVPVNFEFDNVGEIVSGTYVDVYLLGAKRANIISIPKTALVEDQGLFFVYKQVDEEGYQKQEVKLGQTDGERFEVLSGVKPGDIIVTESTYHVKLASMTTTVPHGHEH